MKFEPEYFTLHVPIYGVPMFTENTMSLVSASDGGWASFVREHPNTCPRCKESEGLDENRKCSFCDYDDSPKACEKCGAEYRGESYTKPLCDACYQKKKDKEELKRQKNLTKQQKKWREKQERERIAFRATVAWNDKGEIDVDLDLQDEYGDIIKSLTREQAIDLRDKLSKLLE